ncbi:MAG: trypsin-like peptidase domain-containing protein [Planctomycetia bacterium]|nr:trypsin-like peptidase domain-containing protein [Planctomycetia bacterium]
MFFSSGLAFALLLAWATPSLAEPGGGTATTTSEERQQQYEALNREVDQYLREANILKTVIKLVSPTVVHIEVERGASSGRSRRAVVEEAGSGVIVEVGGKYYALTNRHVIKNHREGEITIRLFDNRELRPLRIWADPDTDVAAMQIAGEHIVPARIGNSDDVEIGDAVIAMGSPFGLSRSVTSGIISAKGRRDQKLVDAGVRLQDFLQTDAAINPGNSGGPLVNLRGEVVGLNTAILSNSGGFEGIGFSIPINMAMRVARHLIENNGIVVRAFLGVEFDEEFNPSVAEKLGLPRPCGARVKVLTQGGPAETAKLRINDVILSFDGLRVDDGFHLVNLVSMTEVGKDVPVVVWRDGREVHLTAKVGDAAKFRPKRPPETPR